MDAKDMQETIRLAFDYIAATVPDNAATVGATENLEDLSKLLHNASNIGSKARRAGRPMTIKEALEAGGNIAVVRNALPYLLLAVRDELEF